MTCIVADSGPLIMFGRSDLLGLVRDVAGDILVPATVFAECTRETVKPGVAALIEARSAGLLAVVSDPDPGFRLPKVVNLDAGEIEALALARQRDYPVLMDESLGRKVAARYGIAVIGSAGILLAAASRCRAAQGGRRPVGCLRPVRNNGERPAWQRGIPWSRCRKGATGWGRHRDEGRV